LIPLLWGKAHLIQASPQVSSYQFSELSEHEVQLIQNFKISMISDGETAQNRLGLKFFPKFSHKPSHAKPLFFTLLGTLKSGFNSSTKPTRAPLLQET